MLMTIKYACDEVKIFKYTPLKKFKQGGACPVCRRRIYLCSSYQLLNGSDTRTKSAKGEIKVRETVAWLARMESPALQNSYS